MLRGTRIPLKVQDCLESVRGNGVSKFYPFTSPTFIAIMSNGTHPSNGSLHTVPLLINGSDHRSIQAFDVVSPATGKVVHRCHSASVDDANLAVEAAAKALKTWRKTPPEQRRDIFLKAAEVMERRRTELRQYMGDETGGEAGWTDFNLTVSINHIKDVAGRIATVEGSFPTTMSPDTSAIVMQEPYGVVLAIAPW